MFTGIIETLGIIQEIKKDKDNVHITIASSITEELQIDQSVAHNGICMTVVAINKNLYTVTAIGETIKKTNMVSHIRLAWKQFQNCDIQSNS